MPTPGNSKVAGEIRWLRADATVLRSEYRDLIGPGPAPGQLFVFEFQNVSRARIRAQELGLTLHRSF